jgi:hypothetical protein
MQAKSKAVPFLSQPEKLDGSMAGDVGFDPLGFSYFVDLKWLREAELKHGRVCMLAWTGCIVQEVPLRPRFRRRQTRNALPCTRCHPRVPQHVSAAAPARI